MGSEEIKVEVAYAKPEVQVILNVTGEPGMTVQQAVERSGVAQKFPEIDLSNIKVGIFGKATTPETELQSGDRVEIYRPLIADPKEVRKRKAAERAAKKEAAAASQEE